MRFYLATMIAVLVATDAHAQSMPNWKSYSLTGNTTDRVPSAGTNDSVAAWLKKKVDVTGGTAASLARTGGSDTGTDISQAMAISGDSQGVGTMARAVAERAMTDPQPHDYLTPGQSVANLISGKIDVGALINGAFNAGRLRMRLPCGTYLLTSTIHMTGHQTLMGDGMCTSLMSAATSGDVLDIAGGINTVRDIRFVTTATKSSGAVIAATKTFHTAIDHIYIEAASGTWWNGIVLLGANDTHINDAEIRPGGTGSGILVTGTSATGRSEDTYIATTNINGWGHDLELAWASGNYLTAMDILSAKSSGVFVDPSSSQEVDGTRASQILSDSNTGDGWYFGGTGPITETTLTNCWASTNGYQQGNPTIVGLADGLHVDNPAVDNFSVANSEFHANTAHGIEISTGTNVNVSGNTLFMNGVAGRTSATDTTSYSGNTYYGVFIDTNASYVIASNNIGGYGGTKNVSTINHQKYLIYALSPNYVTLSGNMGKSHWGGAVTDTGQTDTTHIVNVNNNGN